jgi:hypothetical protein
METGLVVQAPFHHRRREDPREYFKDTYQEKA